MAQASIEVTFSSRDHSRIPDILTEGVLLLVALARRGVLRTIAERLRIRRQGGYCGLDVWILLWLFFSAGASRGIKTFWRVLYPHIRGIAAVAGRRQLASPASVSRALDSAETELVRPAASFLLTEVALVDEVLRHPAMKVYDSKGEGWHAFDLDPTVTTLRQRALPVDDDLPEARRRGVDTGAPGYAGRKRGEIQFRRVTVQHAGSGVWLHAHLSPGNGEGVVDFERALDTIVQTCERLGQPRERALVRMDGEYGNVPWYTACRERKLPFITRLNRPRLYEDPDILARLRSATWYRVADSRSGPRRAAADIGSVTVAPDKSTRRPDGGKYAPVTLRVVATIFPHEGEATRGRTVDGWQVELFAADLPADAWPAPDAITGYFGRTAEENRFAQEDRELGLDRIISYHLPGQELATLVGLSLWNLRLARGFALHPPPAEQPVQRLRKLEVDDRISALWPRDPVLHEILARLDWNAMLANRPGWRWDSTTDELLCDDGRVLTLTTVRRERARGQAGIIFCRPSGGCEDCASRSDCLQSDRSLVPKHVEFSVPAAIADELRNRLKLVRGVRSTSRAAAEPERRPGHCEATESRFLPAAAREAFTTAFLGATLHVRVEQAPEAPPHPKLIAVDAADRQRRRKTWQQNVARYALPEGAKVHIHVAAGPVLRTMLGDALHANNTVGHTV